jgi:hypothetical protein
MYARFASVVCRNEHRKDRGTMAAAAAATGHKDKQKVLGQRFSQSTGVVCLSILSEQQAASSLFR